MKKTKKRFSCVEMKRRIQREIHKETAEMSPAEVVAYFTEKAAKSSFGKLLRQHALGEKR